MRRLGFAGFLFLAIPGFLFAEDSVQIHVVSIGHHEFTVSIQTPVHATPVKVWSVLTDYAHQAQWLPFMIRSEVVQRDADSLWVSQEGKIRVLFKTYFIQVKQQVWEIRPSLMRFQAVEGDFKKLSGKWTLIPAGVHATRLLCSFEMEPRKHAPEWAVRFVARHYLAKMVHQLRLRAEQS